MPPKGYSRSQIALHWVIALLLVPQFILHDAIKHAWYAWLKGTPVTPEPLVLGHLLGGGLLFALTLWRLWLRARRGAPELPAGGNPVLDLIAKAVHGLLYLILVLLPVSGVVAWFGGVAAAAQLHELMKLPLLLLVALHVAGALYHQFIRRDGLIDRMKRAA